jgi:hypothetical protein
MGGGDGDGSMGSEGSEGAEGAEGGAAAESASLLRYLLHFFRAIERDDVIAMALFRSRMAGDA